MLHFVFLSLFNRRSLFLFKTWMRLFAFHVVLIPLAKAWIKLFSFQLCVNSRADWCFNLSMATNQKGQHWIWTSCSSGEGWAQSDNKIYCKSNAPETKPGYRILDSDSHWPWKMDLLHIIYYAQFISYNNIYYIKLYL